MIKKWFSFTLSSIQLSFAVQKITLDRRLVFVHAVVPKKKWNIGYMKNYIKMKACVHYFKWTTGKINEIQYSWKDEKEAVIMKFEVFFPSRLPQVTKVSHMNREECRLHLIALDLKNEKKKKEEPWPTDNILITQPYFSAL